MRLRNINRLAGTWTVDFTDPELAESGLFLISGKTGSGKTTLLDAVSIALFARTTRLGKLSETNSEIMTRNTGECFAEVEFVSTRGWFRSTWTLKRAYKKPNGKVQQPSMRFEHREGENFVIEPLSLAETLRRVEEVTGLTYENFCRSMVLAQGQFDRFLHAKEADRSAILQDITGTDIYEKLSQRAFEHAKKARTAWDNAMDMLGRSAVLSGEELKQKQEELERLVQAQAARRADLVLRQAELAHAEKLAQAERARTAAVQEEVRCGKLVQDLAPDVEALAANERAARLDAPRAALAEAGQVLVRARAERLRLEASTPERERAAQTAIEQETQAQAALAGREAERAAAQPELVRARELDSRLAVSRKEFEDAGAQHEVLAARLTECEKEAAGTSRALAACAGSISKTDEELERTACDSALAGAFQALTLRHRDMLDRAGQADAAGRAE
ncbi:MAG: AAA family ATPase, partial [Desulfovibrionaceae bacterium]|nr:AAA family ATPase [Desulfovibrionaceae bacterium]